MSDRKTTGMFVKILILLIFVPVIFLLSACDNGDSKVVTFNPKSEDYTNVVQDIAVYEEACQNQSSGHYLSKLYEFYFYHDVNGSCFINYNNGIIDIKVTFNKDATHIVRTTTIINGNSITYDVYLKEKGIDGYYTGTCTTQKNI